MSTGTKQSGLRACPALTWFEGWRTKHGRHSAHVDVDANASWKWFLFKDSKIVFSGAADTAAEARRGCFGAFSEHMRWKKAGTAWESIAGVSYRLTVDRLSVQRWEWFACASHGKEPTGTGHTTSEPEAKIAAEAWLAANQLGQAGANPSGAPPIREDVRYAD